MYIMPSDSRVMTSRSGVPRISATWLCSTSDSRSTSPLSRAILRVVLSGCTTNTMASRWGFQSAGALGFGLRMMRSSADQESTRKGPLATGEREAGWLRRDSRATLSKTCLGRMPRMV